MCIAFFLPGDDDDDDYDYYYYVIEFYCMQPYLYSMLRVMLIVKFIFNY